MPRNPEITAALRAGTRAMCAERCAEMGEPPCYEVTGDQGEELPWPPETCNCATLCAVGSAAFLRALGAMPMKEVGGVLIGPVGCRDLAAAVEAAANE